MKLYRSKTNRKFVIRQHGKDAFCVQSLEVPGAYMPGERVFLSHPLDEFYWEQVGFNDYIKLL